mmetsp:Transcript_13080/g.25973  ORF Transcript_13080/g.25973 Transcript_13080/m.25973 type:complete len:330 (+) Transcript_13080:461-1450(+)
MRPRRRARRAQGLAAAVAQPAAGGRPGGPHHLRDQRTRARAGIPRVPQVVHLPGEQGVRRQEGPRPPRPERLRLPADWRPRRQLRRRSLPLPRRRVLLHLRVHPPGALQGPVARPLRHEGRAFHRQRPQRRHRPPRGGHVPDGRPRHALHGRPVHERPRGHSRQGQDRGHEVPHRPRQEPGPDVQGRVRVLRGAGEEGGGGAARRRHLRVLARPGRDAGDEGHVGEDGGAHGPRGLVRAVGLQGVAQEGVQAEPRGGDRRGGYGYGLRRHPRVHDVQGVQGPGLHRPVLVAQQGGGERVGERHRAGEHERLEPRRHRPRDHPRGLLRDH